MITSHINALRLKYLSINGLVLLLLSVTYVSLLVLFPESYVVIHVVALVVLIVLLISFMIGMQRLKKSLLNRKIRVKEIKHMIPYPQKFSDSFIDVGEIFKKYRYKKHMIPEYLIEFREGKMLYLYPIIHEVNDQCYTIVRINKFDIALVIDSQNKKRIVHLGNAELVE